METKTKLDLKDFKENCDNNKIKAKIIDLENKYSSFDENIAMAWIVFTFGSMLTLMLGMPILFIFAIIITLYSNVKMKETEEKIKKALTSYNKDYTHKED